MKSYIIKLQNQLTEYKVKYETFSTQKKSVKTIKKIRRRITDIENQLSSATILDKIIDDYKTKKSIAQ